MALAMLLLVLVVQAGFLVTARNAAAAAADSAARVASRQSVATHEVADQLRDLLVATVPGAREPNVSVNVDERRSSVEVAFTWAPPGPDFIPITIEVRSEVPVGDRP